MRNKANIDIREKAKKSGVALWEIGKAFNVSEFTIIRRLREELPAEEKAKYFSVIEKIANAQTMAV